MGNKIAHELVALYPDLLPRNYLLTHFDKLVNDSVDTVLRLLRVLSSKRIEVFKEALTKLSESAALTLHSLELMYNLALSITVEQRYLDAFLHRWFSACKDMEGATRQKNLRLICKFAVELMRRGRFDASSKIEVWFHYCSHFGNSGAVAEFKEVLAKMLANAPSN